jgi:uncharacterized protein
LGQTTINYQVLKSAFPTELPSDTQYNKGNSSNEIQVIFRGLFTFYKKVFSAQDSKKCSFHPSCSEYGMEAIKLMGIKGIFQTMDRLTRCNGLTPTMYPYLATKQVFYDPVVKKDDYIQNLGKVIDL